MKYPVFGLLCAAAVAVGSAQTARRLDIYFIDVEGGQSTLLVTPDKQSLLIDTGFPGGGKFNSTPGDPHAASAMRIASWRRRDAGISRIDANAIACRAFCTRVRIRTH